MAAFELIAGLASRIASTTRLDEIVASVTPELTRLGFGFVWVAGIDERAGNITTIQVVRDGQDVTSEMPARLTIDPRQPLGHGFRDRKWINVADAAALHALERDADRIPPGTIGLTRISYERVRGHPFVCGPLLGDDGEPVGALCLGSYRAGHAGRAEPIPDDVLAHGVLRALLDLLALALARAHGRDRLAHVSAELARIQAAAAGDVHIKSVGQLAAGAAHDLNNLSGIIQLAVDIAARSPSDATEQVPSIERANRAIHELVARLSRVAVPRPIPDTELAQIVDDVAVMMRAQLDEHKIELAYQLPTLPKVRCDAAVLHQVMLNLLVNAQEALREVSVDRRQITITARDAAGHVRLTVADTGPGLAPEVIEKLFLTKITTKGGSNMGLGLAACQSALSPFGARLGVRNALTGGAVFELVVPAATAPKGAAAPTVPARRPSRQPDEVRLLVVDDEPDVVDVILAYVAPLGYQIATATTSAQALELAGKRAFDLILCDMTMPKLSGLDIARVLRAGDYAGRIVLMTGWDSPTLPDNARDAAIDHLIQKPFDGRDLIQLIERLV